MLFLLFPARCISHAALHVGGWRVLSAFLRGRRNIWVVATQVHRLKQNYPPNNPKTKQEHSVVCWMSDMRSCLCRPWGNIGAVTQRFMCKTVFPGNWPIMQFWMRVSASATGSLLTALWVCPFWASLWVRYGTCFKIPVLILEESGNG